MPGRECADTERSRAEKYSIVQALDDSRTWQLLGYRYVAALKNALNIHSCNFICREVGKHGLHATTADVQPCKAQNRNKRTARLLLCKEIAIQTHVSRC
jgi:hypothetical protein